MSDPVLYSSADGIGHLTLNLPDRRNPISDQALVDALVAHLHAANRDPTLGALILTGAGTAFSSGGDLRKMGAPGELGSGPPAEVRPGYRQGIQQIPLAFETLEVPIIAAVNGPAIGAGCDLACMCDIRVAGESAKFAESFVKVGIIPGDGGAWFLPRLVGLSKAFEMSFTGDTLSAQDALACGLVSRVVPDAELAGTALALAQKIAANPRAAVRMTKRLLKQSLEMKLDALLELSAAMQAIAHTTEDHKEAIAAFREKRAPVFGKT